MIAMEYVIVWPGGGFVKKEDGMNLKVANPRFASSFATREEAMTMRPGHHRDMGGHGFVGGVMKRDAAMRWYEAQQNNRWWRG